MCFFSSLIGCVVFNRLQNCIEFITEEYGNNGRRRFVCTEPVIVTGSSHRNPKQILIIVHRFHYSTEEQQELSVLIRCGAGRKQILSAICHNRPVVMFAAAVYTCKRLFVKQTDKAVLCSYFLHDFHRKLIVVRGNIGGGMDRRQLMLGRGDLVMLSFCQNPQFPEFIV